MENLRQFPFITPLRDVLWRSDSVTLRVGNTLYVWGGYQGTVVENSSPGSNFGLRVLLRDPMVVLLECVFGEDICLPSNEIWLYDFDSGQWEYKRMGGAIPPLLFRACGSCLNGMLYLFGGNGFQGPTNQMFCVDLLDGKFTWRIITDCKGTPPSPRFEHSCWVYKDRLIYFGGYGTKVVYRKDKFTLDDQSWLDNHDVPSPVFRGSNNEVYVFNPSSSTWTEPETKGEIPEPRPSHASAILGNKGYICGGLLTDILYIDTYCLDLDTWTWTHIKPLSPFIPINRTLHTLTPSSLTTLFLFGGLGYKGTVLGDGWELDTVTNEWTERQHSHKNKHRLEHSAVEGPDHEVVVFGGSQEYTFNIDMVTILRSASKKQCRDMLVFQMQPYTLTRLCEDCIGKHGQALKTRVSLLPKQIREKLYKKMTFFS